LPRFTERCCPVVLLCTVVMLGPSPATAQNQGRLYVAVADQAGAPVLDLSGDDFELTLGGAPLTLASVELDNVPPRIAILIDTGGKIRELNAENQLRDGLESFLRTLAPHHEVSLVTLAPNLQRREDFTTDRRKLIDKATGLFSEGGFPRMMDGLRETSERLETWERGFEVRDPWSVIVLVVANGADGSSNINPEQYSDFVNDLVKRQATVHAVVLMGEGTMQATTQTGASLARPEPIAVPDLLPDPLAGGGTIGTISAAGGGALGGGGFPEGSLSQRSETTQDTVFQIAKNITERTRGRFVSINTASGLSDALTELAEQMNEQAAQVSTRYRILYQVPENPGNGQLQLQVRSYEDRGPVTVQPFTDRSLVLTTESVEAEAFRREADGGSVQAMRNLAELYLTGGGVRRDPEQAVRWLRLAADRGDAVAQNDLGFLSSEGQGVEQDQAEAVRWFRLSADQGEATAQFNLGLRYDKGDGVAQDLAEAAELYRQAGEQGHAGAQFQLGGMYDEGRGVAQDIERSIHWYRLAAQQGHAHAQFNLGAVYAEGLGDPAQAAGWYRLAGRQGHPAAQNNLGLMYSQGLGVPPNDVEAVGWYRLAAEQGSSDAQFNLGAMYAQGRGVPQDVLTAYAWIIHAIEGASADAIDRYQTARDAINEQMTAEQREEAENIARLLPSPRPASP
jgi:TPR repeat protein